MKLCKAVWFGLVWSPRLVYGQTAWACHHQWVNEWMAGWIVGRDSCCSVVSLWLLKLIMIWWLYWILRSIHVWNHKLKMMTLSRINCLHHKIKFTFIKKKPAGRRFIVYNALPGGIHGIVNYIKAVSQLMEYNMVRSKPFLRWVL